MGKTRSRRKYSPKKFGKSALDDSETEIETSPVSNRLTNNLTDGGKHVHFAPQQDDSGFITEDESQPYFTYVQPKYAGRNYPDDKDDDRPIDAMRCIGLTVFILCCVFTIFTFALPQPFERLKVRETTGELYLEWEGAKRISLIGLVWACTLAIGLGVSCTCFSWSFTYHDSHKPGRLPPTPFSPRKYRETTGHTFHLSYVMSLLNGAMLCAYALWRLNDTYLFHR